PTLRDRGRVSQDERAEFGRISFESAIRPGRISSPARKRKGPDLKSPGLVFRFGFKLPFLAQHLECERGGMRSASARTGNRDRISAGLGGSGHGQREMRRAGARCGDGVGAKTPGYARGKTRRAKRNRRAESTGNGR